MTVYADTATPMNGYKAGDTMTSGIFQMPLDAREITVSATRNAWAAVNPTQAKPFGDDIIAVQILKSQDGQEWQDAGGFTSCGGDIPAKGGGVLAQSWMTTSIEPGAQVKVQATFMADLQTQIDVAAA